MLSTILVATDFSETSRNAVTYAAELAKLSGSKLILLNVYFNPYTDVEIPVFLPTTHSLKEYSLEELKKIKSGLQIQFGTSLQIDYQCELGFEVDLIKECAAVNKVDLIVMGMNGAGLLKEHLIGSTTTAIIRQSPCPVLAVYRSMPFKPIKNIVLACDYLAPMGDKELKPLKDLVNLFDSHVFVLHVEPEAEFDTTPKEKMGIQPALKNMNYSVQNITGEDLVESINTFVKDHSVDLVVMMPRKHFLIDRVLFEPNTKRMAFHSTTPLLTLHA